MWFSPITSRKSFKSTLPPIIANEMNSTSPSSSSSPSRSSIASGVIALAGRRGTAKQGSGSGNQPNKQSLEAALNYLPPDPIPLTEDNEKTIKSMRGLPIKVNESLSLFISTWNLSGCSINQNDLDLYIDSWIPKGHCLYSIALQDCKRPDVIEACILEYLGGSDRYYSFKSKELFGTTLIVIVDQILYKTGVFRQTRINGLTKHEVKAGKLGTGNSGGRGAICMRFTFHNTILAFISCKLDSKSPEKREADLDFILKDTGTDTPEIQEIGTPALAKVHHVFLLGDFGTRILYPPKSSLKSLIPPVVNIESPWESSRWENLLRYDDLEELRKKNDCFRTFREPAITYPPTAWRRKWEPTSLKSPTRKTLAPTPRNASVASGNNEFLLRGAPRIAVLFEPNFNLDELFDLKSGGVHTLPTYSDRIFFRTLNDFQHLINFAASGTAEGMVLSAHVPVFATFKINGVDKNLLHSWQKMTGNIPPEYATRTDRHLVAGVVAQVQELVQNQIDTAAAAAAEAEAATKAAEEQAAREAEEMKTAPKCIMCNQPCLKKDPMIAELPGDRKVHAACFKCEVCSKNLANSKFFNVESRWLCENDFHNLYSKNCPRCSKPVTSQFLRIGESQYHVDCFTCSNGACQKKLLNTATGEFEPFDELGGKPYCMEHYKEMASLLTCCAACNKLIVEGESAVPHVRKTMNGEETSYFHERCFRCKICNEDLGKSEKKFVISDGEMFCEPDFIKIFGPLQRPAALSKDFSTGERSVSVSIDLQSE